MQYYPHEDRPVEEDTSSDHLVGVRTCPCSPHLLAFQAIEHSLNIKQILVTQLRDITAL